MDAATIGTISGAALATFVAVWRSESARREMRRHHRGGDRDSSPDGDVRQQKLDGERLAKLEARVESNEKRIAEHSAQLQHVVTDETFGAYTSMATGQITELTAAVNRAAGRLEGLK